MIHCLVVVYNISCPDSLTCRKLEEQKSSLFDVTVFDNSLRDYGNDSFCRQKGWHYLGGKGNLGLSKAYNEAIANFPALSEGDYLCLLDDDTQLQDGFFEKVQKQIDGHPSADILLPILKQNGTIVSPSTGKSRKPFFATEEECLLADTQTIAAFNSGMIIRLSVFRAYRYDERIFLDGVDHAFIRDMKKEKKNILVLPVFAEQQYSGGEKGPFEGALVRFRIFARDYRILYEHSPKQYWFIVGKRALHLSLMYRNPVFLRLVFGR